jgi:hypothetical protein
MNDSENRRHQMFVRVRDFGAAHTSAGNSGCVFGRSLPLAVLIGNSPELRLQGTRPIDAAALSYHAVEDNI